MVPKGSKQALKLELLGNQRDKRGKRRNLFVECNMIYKFSFVQHNLQHFRHGTIGLAALVGVCVAIVGGLAAKYSQVTESINHILKLPITLYFYLTVIGTFCCKNIL